MDSLIIQDVFEPYYAGCRPKVAAGKIRTVAKTTWPAKLSPKDAGAEAASGDARSEEADDSKEH